MPLSRSSGLVRLLLRPYTGVQLDVKLSLYREDANFLLFIGQSTKRGGGKGLSTKLRGWGLKVFADSPLKKITFFAASLTWC